MLIIKNTYGYSRNKRYITGKGFVDTISSAFRNIDSFALAKPVLGAIGSLAATGLTAGVPALIKHIANRNKGTRESKIPDDPKYKEILQSMMNPPVPVTNIIGSGIKTF
jgi:hypothetical protein